MMPANVEGSTESNKMEIQSVYTRPRMQEKHRGHVRVHHGLILHWSAVVILVISQFTVIPMLAIIAADTHRPAIHAVSLGDGAAGFNTTTIFKGSPELSP
jgi:hypothetical protein